MRRGFFIIATVFLVLEGCREIAPVYPPVDQPVRSVILVNSSFELGGAASYSGWSASDVQRAGFSSDTPPDGGNWSAALITAPVTPATIQTTVPASPGNTVYKITFWGKKTVVNGSISVLLKRDSGTTTSSQVSVDRVGWNEYALFDTLSTLPGDSVVVRLSGARADIPTGSVLFDLFLLEKL